MIGAMRDKVWRPLYVDSINTQGIVKIKHDYISGIMLHVVGADAKGVDGDVELLEHGRSSGTVAKLGFQDLIKLTNNIFGDAVIDDPGKVAVYLPLTLDKAGYRAPFDGELRLTFPTGYEITVSILTGIQPSVGIAIDSFVAHVGTGRVRIESGVSGKKVQLTFLDGNFTEASLRTPEGDIIAEGDKTSLRGINYIMFSPVIPTDDAILPSIGNRRDDCYIDLISATEQDFRFIIISALTDKIPPLPDQRAVDIR